MINAITSSTSQSNQIEKSNQINELMMNEIINEQPLRTSSQVLVILSKAKDLVVRWYPYLTDQNIRKQQRFFASLRMTTKMCVTLSSQEGIALRRIRPVTEKPPAE